MTNQKLRKRLFIAMSAKFKEMGGQVYLDAENVKESNRGVVI
jgi:hypothetical protein